MFQKKYTFKIKSLLWAVLTLETAFCINACEVHDYWSIPETLVVDETQDRADAEKIETDLFVRYQLDYSVTNTSSSTTEVVVSGTSYVNNTERTTGMKVWRLEGGESGKGILTSSMLEYGNSLQVSLLCCNQSKCSRNEVLCPVDSDTSVASNAGANHALFCYQACEDIDRCVDACPAQTACESFCKAHYPTNKLDECMQTDCAVIGIAQNCNQLCEDDEACLESCTPTKACTQDCSSAGAACYKNCISTWSLCTDSPYTSESTQVPCSLCAPNRNTPKACTYNSTPQWDEGNPVFSLKKVDKLQDPEIVCVDSDNDGNDDDTNCNTYVCDASYDCDVYPSVCLDDCNKIYASGSDSLKAKCLDKCIEQHLFWCNDFYVPSEYIDANYDQPCCYEKACNAEMQGIIKTMDVECFDDSACGSNHYCSSAGICTENGASSCSTSFYKSTPLKYPLSIILLFILTPLIVIRRRRL